MTTEYTDKQIQNAQIIVRRVELKRQLEESGELGKYLQVRINEIVKCQFQLSPVEGEWLSQATLAEVAFQTIKSLDDFRHRYHTSVASFKYLSVICFWIMKLKPVNTLGLKRDGAWISCSNINERIAHRFLMEDVYILMATDAVTEFISVDDAMLTTYAETWNTYFAAEMYTRPDGTDAGIERRQTTKAYETVYHMRFKKMTAINIYESLIHMLLPLKAGARISRKAD